MDRVNEFYLGYRHEDHGPKYFFRGDRFEWGVIRLLPGDTLGGHSHNEVEETFYFPEGTPEMIVNGEAHRVNPGDVFKLSPTETHDIRNDTDQPIKLIFIKCPYIPDDKVPLA